MPVINIFGNKFRLRILRAPRFKKGMTLATPTPWDKLRGGKAALSEAQRRATSAFATVASATAQMPLNQRMEVIKAVLSGKDFGGAKRVRYSPKSPSEVRRLIEELRARV